MNPVARRPTSFGPGQGAGGGPVEYRVRRNLRLTMVRRKTCVRNEPAAFHEVSVMRLAPAPEPNALATRLAAARHRIARLSRGGRGRFGLACSGLRSHRSSGMRRPGSPWRPCSGSSPCAKPGSRPTSRPGWEGSRFWLLALAVAPAARRRRMDRLDRHVAGLLLAGGRSSWPSRGWPSFACDFRS